MDVLNIIYDRFINPIVQKNSRNVGTELEFPLLNMARRPVEKSVAQGFLKRIVSEGFSVDDTDTDGKPAFVVNADGDCISYDNSYNNIEFSMNYGANLTEIRDRFYALYDRARSYFEPFGYVIAGLGCNPYKDYIETSHVSYPVYNMVQEYLTEFDCDKTHCYPDFPAYLSSVQTHLDISAAGAGEAADFFAKMDFAAAFLFANSLAFDGSDYLCFRDYLWENSAFGLLNGNTGCPDIPMRNADGVADSFLNRSMFNRIRNGTYEVFPPVSLENYFDRVGARADDIRQFLSFKNIEITARGTLEIRSTCTQPVSEAFCAPAFYLGLMNNFECAVGTVDGFFGEYGITEKNSVLRKAAIRGKLPEGVDKNGMIRLLTSLVRIAEKGLENRKLGEEFMLKPLISRAQKLESPALAAKRRLEAGESIEDIIRGYSKI